MRIDFDRICELAGTGKRGSSKRTLNESYEDKAQDINEFGDVEAGNLEETDGEPEGDEDPFAEGDENPFAEGDKAEEPMDLDELVEVDISELMSEVRRAKRVIKENRRRSKRKQIAESRRKEDHLKRIIAHEVESILSEIDDKDSSWIYGRRKPRYSKKGYSSQGRTLPGIGFKNNW